MRRIVIPIEAGVAGPAISSARCGRSASLSGRPSVKCKRLYTCAICAAIGALAGYLVNYQITNGFLKVAAVPRRHRPVGDRDHVRRPLSAAQPLPSYTVVDMATEAEQAADPEGAPLFVPVQGAASKPS